MTKKQAALLGDTMCELAIGAAYGYWSGLYGSADAARRILEAMSAAHDGITAYETAAATVKKRTTRKTSKKRVTRKRK